ncbi:hypothetical protein D9M70_521210 [compost metagenome]
MAGGKITLSGLPNIRGEPRSGFRTNDLPVSSRGLVHGQDCSPFANKFAPTGEAGVNPVRPPPFVAPPARPGGQLSGARLALKHAASMSRTLASRCSSQYLSPGVAPCHRNGEEVDKLGSVDLNARVGMPARISSLTPIIISLRSWCAFVLKAGARAVREASLARLAGRQGARPAWRCPAGVPVVFFS